MIEMLTVVAIIAVLVSISIPIINSSLEKAQVTTDQANERAAKGVLLTEYLLAENTGGGSDLFFDNVAGKWTENVPTAYGKCEKHQGCYLKGKISDSGVVEMEWTNGEGKSEPPHSGESLSDNAGGGGGSIPPVSVVPVGTPKDYGDFTVYGTVQDQDLDKTVSFSSASGVLTIKDDAKIIISHIENLTQTTRHRIEVQSDVSANIVLKNVNIDVSGQYYVAAFKIADNSRGNVMITLEGTNTLKSGWGRAGLMKNGAGTNIGTLTITGDGILNVTGGNRRENSSGGKDGGAGIGGGYYGTGSNIKISGGEITAKGGDGSAGIGGGYGGGGSNIEISGGKVIAISGEYGAGIGGGGLGNGNNIKISGGEVTATGDNGSAGIGGGGLGNGNNIKISGGIVKATGGKHGAGIGGGECYYGTGGTGSGIEISGGKVEATGGRRAAGIGGGMEGAGSGITISGGTVTATSGNDRYYGGAGIGGGYYGTGSNIKISGSYVTATAIYGSDYSGEDIGSGGNKPTGTNITINGNPHTPKRSNKLEIIPLDPTPASTP